MHSLKILLFLCSLGSTIGSNPVKTIIISFLVSVLCLIGVINFYDEKRQEKLWVASDSESLKHSEWVSNRYPPQSRIVTVIGEISNVLTPNGMKAVRTETNNFQYSNASIYFSLHFT